MEVKRMLLVNCAKLDESAMLMPALIKIKIDFRITIAMRSLTPASMAHRFTYIASAPRYSAFVNSGGTLIRLALDTCIRQHSSHTYRDP